MDESHSQQHGGITLSQVQKQNEEIEEEKKTLYCIQGQLETQKSDMEHIAKVFRSWLRELQKTDRNNQQLPYLGGIKVICKMVLATLRDREGAFYGDVKRVYASDVPCITMMCNHLESLRKLVTKIGQDEVAYKPGFIEDFHHYLGLLIGVSETLIDIYF